MQQRAGQPRAPPPRKGFIVSLDDPQNWKPPELYIHRAADGNISVVDYIGNLIDSPPEISRIVNGVEKFLDPWGNELDAYTMPTGFRVHTAPDGTMTAVWENGKLLPIQPEFNRSLEDGSIVVAGSDGTPVPVAEYEFDGVYAVHTFQDGTMIAVDYYGVPLTTQPQFVRDSEGEPYAVYSDGQTVQPETYQFSNDFIVHTAADGTMTAVAYNGTPLPVQPNLFRNSEGQPQFVGGDGSTYTPPAYEFPNDYSVHTALDGSMTAVDA